MALGETLTILRKSRGLSQEQLAEELGLTRQTISKWELNQSTPDIAYLVRLSDYFGVSTDYLIKGERSQTRSDDSETETRASKELFGDNVYKWCFYFGVVSMGVALAGIIAFIICSALNPWCAMVNNMVFEGIMGFLIGTKTLWFFVALAILFVTGCSVSVYAIIKSRKGQQSQ